MKDALATFFGFTMLTAAIAIIKLVIAVIAERAKARRKDESDS